MVLLEPVERVGDQEVADLAAAEVEDVGAPVRVLAARGVRVLVERRAVEARQREGVLREVRRHPVDDHADAGLVERVDEVAEAVGVAEPRGGGEVRRDLVAPRPAVRVLHHRQELHVREAEVDEVRHQVVGDLLVGVDVAAPVLLPRAEVHLVDRHRSVHGRLVAAVGHPLVVAPGVRRLEDHRRRRRGSLGVEGHRVGLLAPLAVGAEDQELVLRPRADVGHEQLPDARGAELAHRVLAAVPAVEVALDPHALGRRRPHGERRALDRRGAEALVPVPVRAEHRPQQLVAALVDEVQVHLAEAGQEAVGVVDGWSRPGRSRPRRGSPGRRPRAARRPRCRSTRGPGRRCLLALRAVVGHPDGLGERLEDAHRDACRRWCAVRGSRGGGRGHRGPAAPARRRSPEVQPWWKLLSGSSPQAARSRSGGPVPMWACCVPRRRPRRRPCRRRTRRAASARRR